MKQSIQNFKTMSFLAWVFFVFVTWLAFCHVMPTLLPWVFGPLPAALINPTFMHFFCLLWVLRMIPRLLLRPIK
jgi:hypothetical protein